jgi:thiamine pyrophosphokinase
VLVAHSPQFRERAGRFWLKKRLKSLAAGGSRVRFIAVDGGLDALIEVGISPTLAIGDWDSVGAHGRKLLDKLDPRTVLTFPKKKDRSDLALALLHLTERLIRRSSAASVQVRVLAATGGRPDHHFATVAEMAHISQRSFLLELSLESPEADYFFVTHGILSLGLKKGRVFSVFPWGSEARQVTLSGAEYCIKKGVLRAGSHGLSNRVRNPPVKLSVAHGTLCVVVPH